MISKNKFIPLFLFIIILLFFQNSTFAVLESWNDGPTKEKILNYIKRITDSSSNDYVRPEDRVAVFDNDGTVQPEKPFAFVDMFAIVRIHDLVTKNRKHLTEKYPNWKEDKTILKISSATINTLPELLKNIPYNELLKLFNLAYTGDSQKTINHALNEYVNNFLHPRFKKPPIKLVYKPMIDLIKYLQDNQFTVYFVSGSTVDYLRQLSENIGITKNNNIGWTFNGEVRKNKDGNLYIYKLPDTINPISNKEGKIVNIERYIGRKPLIAIGNSSGDIAMLTYTKENSLPSLCMILNHDDNIREYKYDFDQAVRNTAKSQGWNIISMKKDFKTVFE